MTKVNDNKMKKTITTLYDLRDFLNSLNDEQLRQKAIEAERGMRWIEALDKLPPDWHDVILRNKKTKYLIHNGEIWKSWDDSRCLEMTHESGLGEISYDDIEWLYEPATFALSLPKQDNGDEVYLKLILKIQSWVLDDKTKDTDKLLQDLKQHYSISKK